MKINLTTLLMIVLVAILVIIGGANLIQYLRTDAGSEPKPLAFQPNETDPEQTTTVIATPDANKPTSLVASPINTGGVTTAPLIPNPVNTVYDFYDYVKNKDCSAANKIRPNYDGCQSVDDVNHVSLQLLQAENDRAAVHVDIVFTRNGKEETFDGYLWLKLGADGHWQIQPELMPKNKITAAEFLQNKAGIIPQATTDTRSPDWNDKLDTSLEQLAKQPVDDKLAVPESSDQEAKPETKTGAITTHPEDNIPPPPPVTEQIDPLKITSFGSRKVLEACWSPEQLQGSALDKKLRETTPDHSPPGRLFSRHQLKPLQPGLQGSIRTVMMPDPSKKLVALTFDLCERASEVTGYDAELVNYLRDNNIKATFYAGGKWMRSHPEKAKQLMADPQFEIGNHAWTHGNMRVLSGEDLQVQVNWTQAQYELLWEELAQEVQQCGVSPDEINKIPPLPLSFRYPYGTCGVEALDFMAEQGLPSIQWNIVTADPWRKQTADGIAKTILQGIKPGSIIIAHANGRGWKTGEALSKFIPQLKDKGYEFVTVTELLQAGTAVEAKDSCYELRPGDNAFYDKKVGNGTE